jgi:hypothetical protein
MNSFRRMLCNFLYGLLYPKTFLKSGTPRVDGCSSAIVHVSSLFLLFFFFCILFRFLFSPFFIIGRFHVSAPSLYSQMFIIGYSMSVVPHAGKILLEMLTVDSHWELDTIQLLKHICIFG